MKDLRLFQKLLLASKAEHSGNYTQNEEKRRKELYWKYFSTITTQKNQWERYTAVILEGR